MIIKVAIELKKFPHEVRELMDYEDFNETIGYLLNVDRQQAQANPKQKAAKKRPQTMG